jgi:hypothetical protein
MHRPIRHVVVPATLGLALIALTACGSLDTATETRSTSVSTAADSTPTETPTPTPTPVKNSTPKPKDFRIGIKITKKQCFGSAGCNVTFHVKPVYVGTGELGNGPYEVTYKVIGDESGPLINTFTIDSGTASYQQEEFASTRAAGVKLRAVATDVESA